MLRLPGCVQFHFSETWGLCASKALANFLRPPGGGRGDEEATPLIRLLFWPTPERKEWDEESREEGVAPAVRTQNNGSGAGGGSFRWEGRGGGHLLHTCPSSTNESMFSNCTGNLPFSIS